MYICTTLWLFNTLPSKCNRYVTVCSCWKVDSIALWNRTSFLSNMLNGWSLLRRMMRFRPQRRWIVAGGYSVPSFLHTSITNSDSYLANSTASSILRMSWGQRSAEEEAFLSYIQSSKARRAYWSYFFMFFGKTPFDSFCKSADVARVANRPSFAGLGGTKSSLSKERGIMAIALEQHNVDGLALQWRNSRVARIRCLWS